MAYPVVCRGRLFLRPQVSEFWTLEDCLVAPAHIDCTNITGSGT